jgi:hypothetical protein
MMNVWRTAKETDRTGASSNNEGAVIRASGPPGRPRQMSTAAWNAADIAKRGEPGKGDGAAIERRKPFVHPYLEQIPRL